MKLCFVQDNDSHWYCILVKDKEKFHSLLEEYKKLMDEIIYLTDKNFIEVSHKLDKNESAFMKLFGRDRLNMSISNYCFDNVEEIQ